MTHVSRPLIGLLAATVLVFALWVVALKPHGSSGGSSSGSLGQYQSDIKAAHQAVQTSSAANARAGADPTSAASAATAAAHPAAHPAKVAAAKHAAVVKHAAAVKHATPAKSLPHTPAAVSRFGAVQRALRRHEVLALLFYNPAAPDDRAVNAELRTVPAHSGKVFKLAIPLSEINSYIAITNRVPVNLSPTLVLIAPNGAADEIVGYADPFEISQRVNDALAIRR